MAQKYKTENVRVWDYFHPFNNLGAIECFDTICFGQIVEENLHFCSTYGKIKKYSSNIHLDSTTKDSLDVIMSNASNPTPVTFPRCLSKSSFMGYFSVI